MYEQQKRIRTSLADKGDSNPSPVVHLRELPPHTLEMNVLQVLEPFGNIREIIMLPHLKQALAEFVELSCAESFMKKVAANPISLGGQEIHVTYSTSLHIVQRGGDKNMLKAEETEQSEDDCLESKVLLYTIYNTDHPVTIDVIHKITAPFGDVVRIVMFRKSQVQAMVEMKSSHVARCVKRNLNGADIYAGSCNLKIDFARPTSLTVRKNDSETWDFEAAVTAGPVDHLSGRQSIQTNSLLGSFDTFNSSNGNGQLSPSRCIIPSPVGPNYGQREPLLSGAPADSLTPVMMVYHLDLTQINCDRLFNLFCPYGNVIRIKFLHSNEGSAMVEMSDPYAVDRIIENLSGYTFMGNQLLIRPSRQMKIIDSQQPYQLPDGSQSCKDFAQNRNNRYSTPTLASKNRTFRPSMALHYWNAPLDFNVEDMRSICSEVGSPLPVSMKPYTKTTLRTSSGIVQWAEETQALSALSMVNHYEIPHPEGGSSFILKLAFASEPIRG